MGDFFSPLEEGMASRTEQDEDEERAAEAACSKAGDNQRVFAVWNPAARAAIASGAGLAPRVLLV
eukprot:CAMPEP_0197610270 /NCGR_PEP_ID=MMETSP1326-20131121/52970_1 /TAXON_ID=1155430 /ORGANISM="Genus nov. species nov., Strain RCC2288" /LENGTH=64 /DNA_ID=CAMNT_0043178767 /DNA_START=147 /DNA_END=337 /DNA_ORIENTATION=-